MNEIPLSQHPIPLGIIGWRGFGAFCGDAYRQENLARVVAYAGRDAAAMAQAAERDSVPQTYTDWRALLADPQIELVHIVTPPDLHKEMAVAALEAGKHVLIEKPLATSDTDAQAILEAAQKSGRIAGINYVMRYDPLYQTVAQIAQEGWLGSLTHVGFENYASDEGLADTHWFWDQAQSGGIFVEHGVHFFDIIGHIIGAPAQSVTAQTWIRSDGTNKEDRVQALVTYQNGIEASYYHAFNRPGALEQQTAHFAFEKGHITLSGWIPNALRLQAIVTDEDVTALRRILNVTIVDDEDFPGQGRIVRGHGKEYRVQHRVHAQETLAAPTPVYRRAVQEAMRDLITAIRNPEHQLLVTATDGANSLRLALASRRAAETGCTVEIVS